MGSNYVQDQDKYKSMAKTKELVLSDVMCPICLNIIIEPVTMPCKHELCMYCFKQNVQEANFECPICRTRISSWARRASRENCLINKKRWKEIKRAFPKKVRNRQNGIEDDISIAEFPTFTDPLSEPGEIRKEYELQLKKFQDEEARQRELDAKASEELIQKLHLEEQQMVEKLRVERELIEAQDEIIARELSQTVGYELITAQDEIVTRKSSRKNKECKKFDEAKAVNSNMLKELNTDLKFDIILRSESAVELPRSEDNASASSSRMCVSALTKDFRPSTSTSSFEFGTKINSALRSTSVESHDSITSELHHFKPILAAPKTPPKRLPDGRLFEPKVVQIKARKLDYSSDTEQSQVFADKIKIVMDKSGESGCSDKSSTLVVHTSTPFAGTKYIHKKNVLSSFKENYPFYPDDSPIVSRRQRSTKDEMGEDKMERRLCVSFPQRKHTDHRQNRKAKRKNVAASKPQRPNGSTSDNSWAMDTSDYDESHTLRVNQEERDRKLARQLHYQLNKLTVNRKRGSGNEYELRSSKKKVPTNTKKKS